MSAFDATLDRFGEAVSGPATEVPLARPALLIAQAEHPGIDIDAYEQRLDDMATALRERLDRRDDGVAPAETVNSWLFTELGFRGNELDYDDRRNLLLDEVLDRRIGIPVTLAIVYVEVCQRAGIDARGVGLPGHVVVRVDGEGGEGGDPSFVDVFRGGRRLSEDDCRALVREVYGRRTPFRDSYLCAVTSRQLLQRLLHNQKARALQAGDEDRAGRAIELLLALFPWDLDELRDRGMLRERLGDYPAALSDLEHYVRHRADARDIQTVTEAVRSLRRQVAADAG